MGYRLGFVWVLGAVACATGEREAAPPQAEVQQQEPGSEVIATLTTRDSQLTITSTKHGIRYSLVDAAGVTQQLSLEQLEAYDPQLFEVVKSASARSASERGGPFLDARVEALRSAPAPSAASQGTPPGAALRIQADRTAPRR